jgi:hypothetical protein
MAERHEAKVEKKREADRADAALAADAERRLARIVAIGIPCASVLGAIGVTVVTSLGPAILVLVAGTLLGTIAFLWASLRTLSGDAPLPLELEAMAARTHKVDELAEKKRRVLRALKDLEHEHEVGKIDDNDYAAIATRYREEAKSLMREMDESIDPLREKAEELARKHLAAKGLLDGQEPAAGDEAPAKLARVACPKCETSNDPDAAFCKKCGAALQSEGANAP